MTERTKEAPEYCGYCGSGRPGSGSISRFAALPHVVGALRCQNCGAIYSRVDEWELVVVGSLLKGSVKHEQ